MRILLPMDESPYSEEALRVLLRQMRPKGTHVRVLHVVEPASAYFSYEMIPEIPIDTVQIENERHRQSKDLVARVAKQLRHAGFTSSSLVLSGDAASVIVDQAKAWKADLIVMGSHGLRGFSRFLMGSVSDAVARHAGCSVQIVRKPKPVFASRRRKP